MNKQFPLLAWNKDRKGKKMENTHVKRQNKEE